MVAEGPRRAGWILSDDDLSLIVKRLPGAPIIMDHSVTVAACRDPRPTRKAIEMLGIEEFARSRNPDALLKCPVGRVTSAFLDSRGAARITFTLCRGVSAIVRRGLYAWLSLSHFAGSSDPLEVSVTQSPGRPGCAIDAMVNGGAEYKATVSDSLQRISMETASATPSALETALSKMPEMERKLLSARMCELQKAANDAVEEKGKALTERNKLMTQEATEQDYKALDHVLGQLVDRIDHERYNISPNMYNYASRNDPEILKVRNLENILCACNRALAETVTDRTEPGGKRKRQNDAEPPEAQQQNVLASNATEMLLAQALDDKFSTTASSTVW